MLSSLESHLGYWLRFVSNQVSHAFAQKLLALEVTVAEWVVLRELFEVKSAAPSELAEKLGLTRGAISKLADRLEAKSLAVQSAGGGDRRYRALAITRAGRKLVPRLAALADKNDAEFFGHLARGEREAVERAMRGIVQRLGLKSVPLE